MKDHIEISHLTKLDVFRVSRNDLETWFKSYTNVSNAETVFPKTI